MRSFKTPFMVCGQNFRKLKGDYRVWVAVAILLTLYFYQSSWFTKFSDAYMDGKGVVPWILPFLLDTRRGFVKILMFAPLLLLFCDAPFIDANQPYVISRCSRRSWSIGQVFYIIAVSGLYALTAALLSMTVFIGNMDLTADWGDVIYAITRFLGVEAIPCGVSKKIVDNFTPINAMYFQILLFWLTCIFIGLLTYVVNSITRSAGYGVIVSSFTIVADICVDLITILNYKAASLYYFSPVSWCSLSHIKISEVEQLPSITYVFCAYAALIIILSAIAVIISKKQEIKVVQSV